MFDSEADSQTSHFRQLYSFAFNKSRELLTAVYSISGQNLQVLADEAVHYVDSAFLDFDSFQVKILKVFLAVLLFNVILIIFLWNVYKDRIYERFIQPSSTSIIEELRKSVSQLRLPRGHSPRI